MKSRRDMKWIMSYRCTLFPCVVEFFCQISRYYSKLVIPVKQAWGGAREADWARLLSECWGQNLSRGFESRPPRHKKNAFARARFSRQPRVPEGG